jgi:hypothetical protein
MALTCRDDRIEPATPFAQLHQLARRDVEATAIAFCLSLAAFTLLSTNALLDDGPQLLQEFTHPNGLAVWNHVLYFPAARVIASLGAGDAYALTLLSAISGALVVAFAHATALVVTRSARAAAMTAVAVALTPCVAIHATFVEVHALHAATVAGTVFAVLSLANSAGKATAATVIGTALCALTHRSAPLLGPALACVATVALRQSGAMRPRSIALIAVGIGLALGLSIDEALHSFLGGPRLLDSIAQVEEATRSGAPAMLFDESLLQLPALILGALALGLRSKAHELRVAPLFALVCYGSAIAIAGIATHGGYWLGAVPFLAIGFASCANFALGHSKQLRWMTAISVGISGGIALRAVAFNPERESLAQLREQRSEAARAWLPSGGELLSSGLALQFVDGIAGGVREHDLGTQIGRRLLAGEPIEVIEQAVVDSVRIACAGTTRDVVWTCEWRKIESLPRALHDAMERIEARVIDEFRGEQRLCEHGESWRLDLHGAQ